jgi:hypothetical protein
MKQGDLTNLATDIRIFLNKYGKRDANDPKEWNSPDACELERFAAFLKEGQVLPVVPFSSWGSGGYQPYASDEGRKAHNGLIKRCLALTKEITDEPHE